MSLFQFIICIACLVFLIAGYDLYKRKGLNLIHWIVFVGGLGVMSLFAYSPAYLDVFGRFFGVARGADLLVYISIILFAYGYLALFNKVTKEDVAMTQYISQSTIYMGWSEYIQYYGTVPTSQIDKDYYMFFLRGYNEGNHIGETIESIYAAGYTKILFVDDGSTDDTLTVLTHIRTKYPHCQIIILSHIVNRGRGGAGAATKTGVAFLKKYGDLLDIQYVVGFDPDGQMDIGDMQKFHHAINTYPECDVYLGSRFIVGSTVTNMPRHRKIILWGAKFVTYIFTNMYISDPHIGYRVFTLPLIQKIQLYSDDFSYANELNESLHTFQAKYVEVPVHIRYTAYSLQKGQKSINAINQLMTMIYRKLFFR